MFSGPSPWLNTPVVIIKGNWKGYRGIVKDVRKQGSISGVQLLVELSVWTPTQACPQISVDYDDVREPSHWQPLADFSPLSEKQIYYAPNPGYTPTEYHVPYVPASSMVVPSTHASTPPPPDIKLENLPPNVWWNPQSYRPAHWILDPRLDGLTIEVSIRTESGRNSAWVTVSEGQVHHANQPTMCYDAASIDLPIITPKPNTEKGLLVVIQGKSWFIAGVVRNGGQEGEEELSGERIEVFGADVVQVRETSNAKKWGNQMFSKVRAEERRKRPEVRSR
ncbi:hypothetical protein K435DRAFT_840579 [Dendrothele bispora CBS 962.96]|uniref:KOW domain-containing protein n=1 Tax=Dendrothele bispora (strain CBS 962.96) TaxID=1314807 RepID=A0A4S8LSY9_DENBC|nr:hypothetical protein K435DRAFT_840579 [Dendrothele bispora CBS 962.96]